MDGCFPARCKRQDAAEGTFQIVLHDGERIQRTAPGLFAMPVGMLWEA